MDPLPTFITKLKSHPERRYEEFAGGVRVAPLTPTGFALELRSDTDTWDVYLGNAGFHESFTSGDEVLNFMAWCYSGDARVREVWRGNAPQKAILEYLEDGRWSVSSETVFFLVPFWRKRTEITLQNPNLLSA